MEILFFIIIVAVIASAVNKSCGGSSQGEKCPKCKRRTLHSRITGPHHMEDSCSHCGYSSTY